MTPASSHGAHSEQGLRGRKTRLKRRFLAARGLRETELAPAVQQALDDYIEVAAKVEALDEWFDVHGLVDEATGEPHAPTRFYIAVLNSSQRAVARLEGYLVKQAIQDPEQRLRDYLATLPEPDQDGDE
jgi:hypothetical protein